MLAVSLGKQTNKKSKAGKGERSTLQALNVLHLDKGRDTVWIIALLLHV